MSDRDLRERYEYRAAWLQYVDGLGREAAEHESRRRLLNDDDLSDKHVESAIPPHPAQEE